MNHLMNFFRRVLFSNSLISICRTTASTNMNDTSSRSHAIFTIVFTQVCIVHWVVMLFEEEGDNNRMVKWKVTILNYY